MKHEEEVKSDDYIYYLVGLLSGLFIGATLESSFIWVPVLGVVGLLFAAFFLAVFVRGGRGEKA
jgi:hypothetical protein